ncbi:MAG: TonB-dependent receptor plug domain-containing protein [Boseongicola sp.]
MSLRTCLWLTAAVLPHSVAAQGAFELDEAFVFSGLLPVEVNRTGASVEVITDDDLSGANQGVQETITRLPGISVVANGGLGQESTLAIRGLGETYIGVTFDGIEVTDPAAPTNAYAFGQLTGAAVGRIEVAKGTQTAVYGSDAIAGAVNITSWRPEKDGFSGQATVEAGSYDTLAATLSMGNRFESGEVAFTASRIVSDGYAADVTNTEKDGFQQTLLTFSIEGSLSETVGAGLTIFHSDDETEYDAFGSTVGLSDGTRTGARVFGTYAGDKVEHELAFSYFDANRDEISAFGPFPFEGTRKKVEYIGRAEYSKDLALAFGADWTQETSSAGGMPFEDENGGVFGEFNYAVSDYTDVAVSLRHDVYSDFSDQTTGRLAVVHRMPGDLNLKGTLGTGYRAPSLQERYGFGGDPTFVPEESLGGDLGITKDFENGFVSATAFYTEIDNLIRYDRATFSLFQLPGTTISQGVELAADWQFGSATVFGNYTYTDAATQGARLVRVPRHDLVVGVEMPLMDKLSGGLDIRHVNGLTDVDALGASVPLDDYTVASLNLTYQIGEMTEAYIRVENIFDESYQTTLGYDAPGRGVFVGLRASF